MQYFDSPQAESDTEPALLQSTRVDYLDQLIAENEAKKDELTKKEAA